MRRFRSLSFDAASSHLPPPTPHVSCCPPTPVGRAPCFASACCPEPWHRHHLLARRSVWRHQYTLVSRRTHVGCKVVTAPELRQRGVCRELPRQLRHAFAPQRVMAQTVRTRRDDHHRAYSRTRIHTHSSSSSEGQDWTTAAKPTMPAWRILLKGSSSDSKHAACARAPASAVAPSSQRW